TCAMVGVIVGLYGTLVVNADGSYRYVVNDNNAAVQALGVGDTLQETFTYALSDAGNLNDTADLVITIQGRQDNPVAVNDLNQATAGSVPLGTAPIDATGNVITGTPGTGLDSDVDAIDNPVSTQLHVNAASQGAQPASATLGSIGGPVAGLYGSLTIAANGAYTYAVDSNNAAVKALPAGATLTEVFTYQIVDSSGLPARAQLIITVVGVNDIPTTVNDIGNAVEAGGTFNGTPGVNPTGNVLSNDSDPDGTPLTVTAIQTSGGTVGTVGQVLNGLYGTLTLNANGSYSYVVNNSLPAVQALLPGSPPLQDVFTYTASDGDVAHPGNQTATLTINIAGRNDAPVAVNDTVTAVEAGGVNNNVPGTNPSVSAPGLLGNDTDVDAADGKSITGIRTGSEAAGGAFTVVSGSQVVLGTYGTLTVNADGSYTYVVNNSLAAVQALKPGDAPLVELFSYRVADTGGLTDIAQLTINITGAWDNPVAVNNVNYSVPDRINTPAYNPSGNVLTNDTDVDRNDVLVVDQIESTSGGTLAVAAGTTNGNGTSISGLYGTLVIGANGTYTYTIDSTNPTVIALGPLNVITDVFNYRNKDLGGLNDTAELKIYIRGGNEAPVAVDDSNVASDQTPTPQASGNVLPNDFDVDTASSLNERLEVTAIRTGSETGSGTTGVLGQALQGLYGTLTLNADGSYTYAIDLRNPTVLAAAGLGQVLQDVFTYTVADFWGATDQAQLVINLDIAAPFVPAPEGNGPYLPNRDGADGQSTFNKDIQPVVFVTPVVQAEGKRVEVAEWHSDGSDLRLGMPARIESRSLADGLGQIHGQFVREAVLDSAFDRELDLAWILGPHGRLDMNADGLLDDPSLFAASPRDFNPAAEQPAPPPSKPTTASSFQRQLENARAHVQPLAAVTPSSHRTP
ncbi:MAG: VCBS domain-containing protein, partial [Pseudomonas sp.]